MLATSPQTARFISTKLAVRFVSDTPPPAMIDTMAATFTRTNGNIRAAVLLAMINSPEFFYTAGAYRAKVKTRRRSTLYPPPSAPPARMSKAPPQWPT